MSQYIEPIKTAVLFFPFVALLFTMPYMLVQYRKYGAILLMRTAVIYSFILYLMCAYFLTILPLPDWDFVAGLTSPTIQLIPLREVVDLFRHSAVEWSNPVTYYRLFTGHDFFQIGRQRGDDHSLWDLSSVLFRLWIQKDGDADTWPQPGF